MKLKDPLFLYEGVKVCDHCYKYLKAMLEFLHL
jgi:hypothetical protein